MRYMQPTTRLFLRHDNDEENSKDLELDDIYKTTYLTARLRACDFLESRSEIVAPAALDSAPTPRTFKLPTIELPKLNGNFKEWLPFWTVFRKFHEDPPIRKEDKFQYLIQPTIPDSRARNVVSSFPHTSENYEKVITSLKSRFGRDEVVEFYVRELLVFVLQNAVNGYQRASLANIYDKLEGTFEPSIRLA